MSHRQPTAGRAGRRSPFALFPSGRTCRRPEREDLKRKSEELPSPEELATDEAEAAQGGKADSPSRADELLFKQQPLLTYPNLKGAVGPCN